MRGTGAHDSWLVGHLVHLLLPLTLPQARRFVPLFDPKADRRP